MVAPGKRLQYKILIENLNEHANMVADLKEGQVANANRDWPVLNRAGVRWVPSLGDQGWAGLRAQLHGLVSKLLITDR